MAVNTNIDFQNLKTTGIKVNYLYVCERKLWLFDRGIAMESKSDKVLMGKLLGEHSYPRDRNVSGELTVKQVQYYLNDKRRFFIALCFVEAALFHILRNLRGYSNTEEFQRHISAELDKAHETKSISELMGCEGRARDSYYQAFNAILKDEFAMEKREKRPPTNPMFHLNHVGYKELISPE